MQRLCFINLILLFKEESTKTKKREFHLWLALKEVGLLWQVLYESTYGTFKDLCLEWLPVDTLQSSYMGKKQKN
jgi:hypothetical protein